MARGAPPPRSCTHTSHRITRKLTSRQRLDSHRHGGPWCCISSRAPPRLAHHPGAPLSWEGSRSGSGRWLRGQVTGLPPEQAPRSARNLRVPVQVSVGTEIFREMTGRSAGAGGRRARPGLGWEAGERGGAHGGRRPWRPAGRRAERRPGTHRPAPAVCAHVAVHLEAGGVVRGEDGVHAVLLLPAEQDVQAVPRPRACGGDGREGGWAPARAPARPPLSPGLAD